MRHVSIVLLLVLLASPPAGSGVIRVDWTGGGDFRTIQEGVDEASPGDTVLVACGQYPAIEVQMRSGIYLTSETGDPECVYVNPFHQGRAFNCVGVDSTAVIRGFTIIDGAEYDGAGILCSEGSSLRIENVVFTACHADNDGGGLACLDYGEPQLQNVIFEGNSAGSSGGGMFCGYTSRPSLEDCVFRHNTAVYGGGLRCHSAAPVLDGVEFRHNSVNADVGLGGGMWCAYASDPQLSAVTFSGNSAGKGGALACEGSSPHVAVALFEGNVASSEGGALYLHSSDPVIEHAVLNGNMSGEDGGAVSCQYSAPVFRHTLFRGNQSANGGGALVSWGSPPLIESCTLSENGAALGGAVYLYGDAPTISNVIISFCTSGGAVYCDGGATPTLTCCDVYGNADGDWLGCIAGQYGLSGNISEDPLFCDPEYDNYMLDEMSPCAPASNSCGVLIGAYDVGCGASAVQSASWGAIKAMYR